MKDIIRNLKQLRISKSCVVTSVLLLSLGCNIGVSYKLYKQPRLAKIDVDYFIKDAVKKVAQKGGDDKEVKEAIKAEILKLDSYLEALCAKENLIVLPAKAVVGGGIDITEQIIEVMANEK
jgi:hypothetical protein